MEKLTLKKAKILSEKKWQYIVDNNGSEKNLDIAYPKLMSMLSNCAMCEYHINLKDKDCASCLYTNICDNQFAHYLRDGNKETALMVLEAIKAANKPKNKGMDLKEEIKEAARIYAELKKGFDMEDELYYQKQKVDVYNAFIAGARAHEALDINWLKDY